jgi:hypothetical protein
MLCVLCAALIVDEPISQQQQVTIDPAVIATLTTQVHAATTMAALRTVLVDVLDAINPST